MRQAGNWLVVGASGSGKTRYVTDLVRAYQGRYRYLVVINTTKQLAEFCRRREYVSLEALKRAYSPRKLADLIQAYGSVHFEVAPGDCRDFLSALGHAVMSLGRYETGRCEVLVVVDEARVFLRKYRMPEGFERIEAEGRKFGIDIIKATQRMGSSGQDTIDQAAITQVTRVVVLPLAERNERDRILDTWPELPDPTNLQRPDPAKGWGGEYIVWDVLRGQGSQVRRDASGDRYAQPIGGGL